MSEEERAALIRKISEQYSIPSDASTPQGQCAVTVNATPKTRVKRRAVFTPKEGHKRSARAQDMPSGLESLAEAAGAAAVELEFTEPARVPTAPENFHFTERVQHAVAEMIFNSGRPRYYKWFSEQWQSGSEEWMVGLPVPCQVKVQHWYRRRRE